jgi:hypothetical protein
VPREDVDAVEGEHVPHGQDGVLRAGDQYVGVEVDRGNHVVVGLEKKSSAMNFNEVMKDMFSIQFEIFYLFIEL